MDSRPLPAAGRPGTASRPLPASGRPSLVPLASGSLVSPGTQPLAPTSGTPTAAAPQVLTGSAAAAAVRAANDALKTGAAVSTTGSTLPLDPSNSQALELPPGEVQSVIQLSEEQAAQLRVAIAAGYSVEDALLGMGIDLKAMSASAGRSTRGSSDAAAAFQSAGVALRSNTMGPAVASFERMSTAGGIGAAAGIAGVASSMQQRTVARRNPPKTLPMLMASVKKGPRCMLRVWGMEAKGLRAADRTGLSDPYIILRVGAERWVSRVITQTLSPRWSRLEDQCLFGSAGHAKALGIAEATIPQNTSIMPLKPCDFEREDVLYITLMDKDTFGSDEELGHACVFFGDLFPVSTPSLSSASPASPVGGAGSGSGSGSGGGSGAVSVAVSSAPDDRDLPPTRGKAIWLRAMHEGAPFGAFFLCLEAIGIRPPLGGAILTIDSAPAAAFAGSDGQSLASPGSGLLSPSAAEVAIAASTAATDAAVSQAVASGAASAISGAVAAATAATKGAAAPFFGDGSLAAGAGGAAGGASSAGREPNCFKIRVHRAQGLIPRTSTSTCNPYFQLTVGGFTVKSPVQSGTCDPSWGQGWAFPITDRMASVALEVWHSGAFGSSKLQGKFTGLLADLEEDRTRPATRTLRLVNKRGEADKARGTVGIEVLWCYHASFDPEANGTAAAALSAAAAAAGGPSSSFSLFGGRKPVDKRKPLQPIALDNKGDMPTAAPVIMVLPSGEQVVADAAAAGRQGDGAWGEVDATDKEANSPIPAPQNKGASPAGAAGAPGTSTAIVPAAGAAPATRGAAAAAAAAAASRRVDLLSSVDIRGGDWQVQVHVIEARALKAENMDGTSDPVVYVEVGSQKQHTAIHSGTTGCVFDEHLFFNFPRMARSDVEALSIRISVFDANVVFRNTMIGLFTFDACEVYFQPQHAYYKRWVGLVDPSNPRDRGIQGYLRLSVVVLGPGDRLTLPELGQVPRPIAAAGAAAGGAEGDSGSASGAGAGSGDKGAGGGGGGKDGIAAGKDADESGSGSGGLSSMLTLFKGRKNASLQMDFSKDDDDAGDVGESDGESFADSLVLLPPSITRRIQWLVVVVHAADGLPAMDEGALGGLIQPGIDAFVQVSFAGNPPARTQWITRKGTGALGVEWHRELWLPFLAPAFSNRVEIAVYDFDLLKANDRVGTVLLNTRDFEKAPLPLAWWPIYGAPDSISYGAFKNRMNRLPAVASNYRGRLLLSARIEEESDPDSTEKNPSREEVHWRPTVRPPRELLPPLAVYRLRALVIAGDELPSVTGNFLAAAAAATGLASGPRLGIMISLAGKSLWTPTVTATRGAASWKFHMECDVTLPAAAGGVAYGAPSPAPLPDTFIYLYEGDPWSPSCRRISYARLDTASLLRRGLSGAVPFWQPLKEDVALNALSDTDTAGIVLLKLGVGPLGEALSTDWEQELLELDVKRPFELRVHVYQGRGLPAADSNGTLDPYLKVTIAGQTRTTTTRFETSAPCWYETLSFDLMLPPLRFAPCVHVELFDTDDYTADDYVAEFRHPLPSPYTLISSSGNLPPELPDPHWFKLCRYDTRATNREDGDGDDSGSGSAEHGEVLVLFQLITKPSRDTVVPAIPASIVPPSRDLWLEVIALGCRALAPYAYAPVTFPHVELEVSDVRTALARLTRRAKRSNELSTRTSKSRYPSGSNPNFCDILVLPVKVPLNPLFAPSLNLQIIDNRLGGFAPVTVGSAAVSLAAKIPWSSAFVGPRGICRSAAANPFSAAADPLADPSCAAGSELCALGGGRRPSSLQVAGGPAASSAADKSQAGPSRRGSASGAANSKHPRGTGSAGIRGFLSQLRTTTLSSMGSFLFPASASASAAGGASGTGAASHGGATAAAGAGAGAMPRPQASPISPRSGGASMAMQPPPLLAQADVDSGAAAAGDELRSPTSSSTSGGVASDAGVTVPRAMLDAMSAAAATGTATGDDAYTDGTGDIHRSSRGSRASMASAAASPPSRLYPSMPASAPSASPASPLTPAGAVAGAASGDYGAASPDAVTLDMSPRAGYGIGAAAATAAGHASPTAAAHSPEVSAGVSKDGTGAGSGGLLRRIVEGVTAILPAPFRKGVAPDASAGEGSSDSGSTCVAPSGEIVRVGPQTCAGRGGCLSPKDAEIMRNYGIDLRRGLVKPCAAVGVDEESSIAYLKDRKEYACGLEDVFGSAPWESYAVTRGQRVGRGLLGDNARNVGMFKGIVRLMESPAEAAPVCLHTLLNPQMYVIRVYVLTGHAIQPKDSNGKSDPYLVVRLGDQKVSRRADYVPETTEPAFYQCFELKTTLPGQSVLSIDVWDYDLITSDDFIGSTTIDLEDRWFEPAWRALGEDAETGERLRPKPIERRDLWAPTSTASQGALRLWVDILTAADALKYPAINITPPPPRPYELRAIVWKARGMTAGDYIGGMNDLYFKGWCEGMPSQSTDVHYRAKKGAGSFNWRMVWRVTLPRPFFYITLQAWDKDLLKYSDCLGEAKLDLGPHVRRALASPRKGIHIFRSDADVMREREAAKARQARKDAARVAKAAADIAREDERRAARMASQLVRSGIATEPVAKAMAAQALHRRRTKAAALLPGAAPGVRTMNSAEEEAALQAEFDAVVAETTGIGSARGASLGLADGPGAGAGAGAGAGSGLQLANLRTRSRYAGASPGFAVKRGAASADVLAGRAAPHSAGKDTMFLGQGEDGDGDMDDPNDGGAAGMDGAAVSGATGSTVAAEMLERGAANASGALGYGASSGEVRSFSDTATTAVSAGVTAAASGIASLFSGGTAAAPTTAQRAAMASGSMSPGAATADNSVAAAAAARAAGGPSISTTAAASQLGLSTSTTLLASAAGVPLGGLVGLRNAAEAGDARATVRALKAAAGIEQDVHPEHAQWVKMYKMVPGKGASGGLERKEAGEVLVTLELLPAPVATKYPAGLGRGAPNQYPTLPSPAGRIRCSFNPCYLCAELCGRRVCTSMLCCLGCVFVFVAIGIGAPFIHTIMLWLQLLPKEVGVPLAVCLFLLLCVPPCYGYWRYVACPKVLDRDEAEIGATASDFADDAMDLADGVPIAEMAGSGVSDSEDESHAGSDGAGVARKRRSGGEEAAAGGAVFAAATRGGSGSGSGSGSNATAGEESASLLGKK